MQLKYRLGRSHKKKTKVCGRLDSETLSHVTFPSPRCHMHDSPISVVCWPASWGQRVTGRQVLGASNWFKRIT